MLTDQLNTVLPCETCLAHHNMTKCALAEHMNNDCYVVCRLVSEQGGLYLVLPVQESKQKYCSLDDKDFAQ